MVKLEHIIYASTSVQNSSSIWGKKYTWEMHNALFLHMNGYNIIFILFNLSIVLLNLYYYNITPPPQKKTHIKRQHRYLPFSSILSLLSNITTFFFFFFFEGNEKSRYSSPVSWIVTSSSGSGCGSSSCFYNK